MFFWELDFFWSFEPKYLTLVNIYKIAKDTIGKHF